MEEPLISIEGVVWDVYRGITEPEVAMRQIEGYLHYHLKYLKADLQKHKPLPVFPETKNMTEEQYKYFCKGSIAMSRYYEELINSKMKQ